MKKSKNWVPWIIAIIALVAAFFFISRGGSSSGSLDEFAQCLTDSGAVMYGSYWCGHCQNQKASFGDGWNKINFIECDPNGEGARPQLCEQKGITGYPTWIFADGERLSGELSHKVLASKTGCGAP
ncbi:MAG: thioredoxin domain-containing protein [archaeon]